MNKRTESARRLNEGRVKDYKALSIIRKNKLNFCLYCESFTTEEKYCGSATKKCKH